MTGERKLEKRIELDASPEQVWEAIATGPGISAWFVPTAITDDMITQDFGSGNTLTGQITANEPGRRFRYGAVEPIPQGTPNLAFEFLVEAREGSGTVLRFVQSGFAPTGNADEGWEAEYDSYDTGWDLFFANLASYLEHFPGAPVTGVTTMGWAGETPAAQAWPLIYGALGLPGRPSVGDSVRLVPDGPAPIEGIVDVANEAFLGVRTTHGLHRIGAEAAGGGCGVSAYHYYYGVEIDAAKVAADWDSWLGRLFPSTQPVG